jgi:hypothetical protein
LGLGIPALAEPLPEFPMPGCSFRVAIIGASRSISEQGVTAARTMPLDAPAAPQSSACIYFFCLHLFAYSQKV